MNRQTAVNARAEALLVRLRVFHDQIEELLSEQACFVSEDASGDLLCALRKAVDEQNRLTVEFAEALGRKASEPWSATDF